MTCHCDFEMLKHLNLPLCCSAFLNLLLSNLWISCCLWVESILSVYRPSHKLPQIVQGHILFVCFDPVFASQLFPCLKCNRLRDLISVTVSFFMLLHFASCVSCVVFDCSWVGVYFVRLDALIDSCATHHVSHPHRNVWASTVKGRQSSPKHLQETMRHKCSSQKHKIPVNTCYVFKIWSYVVKQSVLRTSVCMCAVSSVFLVYRSSNILLKPNRNSANCVKEEFLVYLYVVQVIFINGNEKVL